MRRGDVVLVIAAVLVLTGVALVSIPAALIAAGLVAGAAWYWFVDGGSLM